MEAEHDPDGRWRARFNQQLATDYRRWFDPIDHLIMLCAPSFEVVHQWRWQQEQKLIDKMGGNTDQTMSEQQVATFIQYYERLTRHMLEEMPTRADTLIRLDEHRQVLSCEQREF